RTAKSDAFDANSLRAESGVRHSPSRSRWGGGRRRRRWAAREARQPVRRAVHGVLDTQIPLRLLVCLVTVVGPTVGILIVHLVHGLQLGLQVRLDCAEG